MYILAAKGLMILGVLLAIGVGIHYVDAKLEHHYGDPIRAAWKASDDKRIAFQTALVLSMSKALMDSIGKAEERERIRDAEFTELEGRARRLVIGRITTLSDESRRLLSATTRAANAARPDPIAETGADTISPTAQTVAYEERDLTLFIVQSGKAYADAYGLWKDCREREDVIRTYLKKGVEADGHANVDSSDSSVVSSDRDVYASAQVSR